MPALPPVGSRTAFLETLALFGRLWICWIGVPAERRGGPAWNGGFGGDAVSPRLHVPGASQLWGRCGGVRSHRPRTAEAGRVEGEAPQCARPPRSISAKELPEILPKVKEASRDAVYTTVHVCETLKQKHQAETSDRHAGLAGCRGHRVEQIDRQRAGKDLDEVIAGRLLSTDHLDGGLCCDRLHHSRRAAPTCRPSD